MAWFRNNLPTDKNIEYSSFHKGISGERQITRSKEGLAANISYRIDPLTAGVLEFVHHNVTSLIAVNTLLGKHGSPLTVLHRATICYD